MPIADEALDGLLEFEVDLFVGDDDLEGCDQVPHFVGDTFLFGDGREQVFCLEFDVPQLTHVDFGGLEGLHEPIDLLRLGGIEAVGCVDFEEFIRQGVPQPGEGEGDEFFE